MERERQHWEGEKEKGTKRVGAERKRQPPNIYP